MELMTIHCHNHYITASTEPQHINKGNTADYKVKMLQFYCQNYDRVGNMMTCIPQSFLVNLKLFNLQLQTGNSVAQLCHETFHPAFLLQNTFHFMAVIQASLC